MVVSRNKLTSLLNTVNYPVLYYMIYVKDVDAEVVLVIGVSTIMNKSNTMKI